MATDLHIEAENRPGQLATIGEALGKAGINVDGFCATVTDGQAAVHVLVDDPGGARRALEGAGYTVAAEREALVVDGVKDRPGYLGVVGRRLAAGGVNIEVAYVATATRLVFGVDDIAAARAAVES